MIELIIAASLSGTFLKGTDLNRLCQDASPQCTSYVLGVVDGSRAAVAADRTFCLSREIKSSQLRDAVKHHLEEEPEQRHLPAASIVRQVLHEHFPCPKPNGR
ncbi:Rap1a/Tai family immunity protein [Sphingomonas aurantiaca]|uniref:Rap1a/Tai family immunity protein n=1 Tax=Sphingomonas aurantiaca TaxID=185949 RepID=UPI003361AF22